MAGRFGLNLRPVYGADEQTGPEQVQRGIGSAIDSYMALKEQGRQERNTMAAAGAVRQPRSAPQGIMGRVRRAIGADDGYGEPGMPAPAAMPQPVGAGPTPAFNPNTATTGDTNRQIAGGVMPMTPPRPNIASSMAEAMNMGHTPGMNGNPAADAAPSPVAASTPTSPAVHRGISSALQPYTVEGAQGDRYSVDPLHEQRVKDGLSSEHENEQIQALVDAGMPEATARAKVLNKVVRYDETFGQKTRGGSVSQTDWAAREAQRQANRREMEQLHQAGRISSQELQRRRLDMEREAAEDRRNAAADRSSNEDVRNETAIAGQYGKRVPNNPVAAAMQSPAEKAASDKARREADKHLGAAVDAQTARRNAKAPQTQAAARARALKAAGKSREEIAATMTAEGYRITH